MENGYIKLYRCLQDNELWQEKPFDKSRAWIDLLLLTNYKDGGYWLRGIWVEVRRGECGWSQIKLAERWGWSRDKVRRNIRAWVGKKMVTQKTIQQNKFLSSLIIITNYEEYQCDDTASRQQTDSKQGRNKKGKKDKKIKHIYGSHKNVRLTDKEKASLKEKFGEVVAKEWVEILSEGIALKGYKYESHYLAILSWDRKKQGGNGKASTTPQTESCKICGTTDWQTIISGRCEKCKEARI